MEPKRVIIDTDPGVDDAAAILFALGSPELRVEAITTVYGNAELEQCTRNALAILEAAGRADIPVYRGAAKPLLREARFAQFIHGEDGLGDAGLGVPRAKAAAGRAAEELVRRIMAAPGELTLLALGPPTNVALAACLEPRIAEGVRELIYMGGAAFTVGNASPVASANNLNDPEAAAIMYQAGFPLVQVGLDVCQHCYVTEPELAELGRSASPAARFFAAISRNRMGDEERHWAGAQGFTQYGAGPWVHFNDVPCTAYAVAPELFEAREAYVEIETRSRSSDGQTVVDLRGQLGRPPNARVCLRVDGRAVTRRLLEALHRA
jgi:inosine-uridine nucleoside N-ribohydrolase